MPVSELSPILEFLIGSYVYGLHKMADGITPYGGIGALDFGYFARFIFLMIAFIMAMGIISKIIVRMFGVLRK